MSQALDKKIADHLSLLHDYEKRSLLGVIKAFLSNRKEETRRLTIEEYNQQLEESEAEYHRGEFVTSEELLKEIKEWGKK